MKRLFVAISLGVLALFAGSCDLGLFTRIEPPDWIQGSWSDAPGINNWAFQSDNAVFSTTGLTVDFAEYSTTVGVMVSDSVSGDTYRIIMDEYGDEYTYSFAQTSDTSLDYRIAGPGTLLGPLELVKN